MSFKTHLLTALICFPVLSGISTSQSSSAPTWSFLEDADQDGMTDIDEILLGLDPLDPADGLSDLDGDGLSLAWEFSIGTHSSVADTDADGWSDSEEYLLYGTDPINWMSFPLTSGSPTGAAPAPASSPAAAPAPPPPPPPAPSLDNGEFSVVNFTNWINALGSTSYQNGGFKWGAGAIGGWTAYVGSTVEVWEVGSERFIELDGSAGNYGVKQPIANVRAGGYVLTWKQCGRTHSNAGSDPYKVKVYYMNGSNEVVLCLSPLYAGFSKTVWTDNALGFQISPDQLIAVGTNPIYVAYVPLGSMNTYGTLIDKVNLIPIDIEEVISDQISGNEANKLPTAYFGGNPAKPKNGHPNNPMLMGTRTGSDARLMIKMNVSAAHAASIRVGVRQTGQTTILNSTVSVATPGNTPLSFTALSGTNPTKLYEVVAGYDINSNSVLENSEVAMVFEKTPRKDKEGNTATANLHLLDKLIIVTLDDFMVARAATDDYGTGTTINTFFPTAARMVAGFSRGANTITGSGPPEPGVLLDASTIPSSQGLSHPLGGKWNAANQTTTHRLVLPTGSDLSEDVVGSTGLRNMYERALWNHKATILAGASASWGVVKITFSDKDIDFSSSDTNDQVHAALGKCEFVGSLEVSCKLNAGGGFDVGALNCYGAMVDLYDFAYGASKVTVLGMDIADPKEAARTQAGYATLTFSPWPDAGRVFFTKVEFGTGWFDYTGSYPP